MTEPTPPAAPTPGSPAPASTPPAARPQPSLRRPPPPRRDEPEPSRPPVLDRQELNLEPPKLRELDAAIESELEAALAGFSASDFSAEPAKAGRKDPTAPKEQQRGKVIAIHHSDVFVEVPGGKSQGVLSLTQFEEAAENRRYRRILSRALRPGQRVARADPARRGSHSRLVERAHRPDRRSPCHRHEQRRVGRRSQRHPSLSAHQSNRSLPSRKCRAVR